MMARLVRWLAIIAVILISEGAWAQAVICRSAAADSAILQMLDQAGLLEQSLQQVLTATKSQSTSKEASQKLEVLSLYMEALLEPNPQFSLIEIHEGLQRLPVFREELPQLPETVVRTRNPYLLQVIMVKRADKDFADVPHYIRAKFLEFINEASGLVSITFLSPQWSLKHLAESEEIPPNSYSVRLNRGYRVFFTLSAKPKSPLKDKLITVYRISMKVTHDSH
jgi:hypothetical protein